MTSPTNNARPDSLFRLPTGMLAITIAAVSGTVIFNTFPLFLGYAADRFQLDDIQAGFFGSAFMLGYTIATFSSLLWISKCNWRKSAAISIVISTFVLAGSLFVSDFRVLIAIALFVGATSCVSQLLANAWIDRSDNPDPLFGAKGVIDLSAAAVAMLVLAIAFNEGDFTSLIIVYGLVFAFAFVAALRLRPPAHREETHIIRGTPRSWAALGVLALHSTAMVGFWGFAERVGRDADLSSSELGQLMSAAMVAGIAGAAFSSYLARRVQLKNGLTALYIAMLVTIALFAVDGGKTGYIIAILLFQFTWISLNILQIAFVADADEHQGLVAIVSVGMTAGGAAGPVTAGFLRTEIGNVGLYIFVVTITLICAILTWLISRQPRAISD